MPTYKVKDIPGFENLLVVGTFRQIGAVGEAFRFLEVEQIVDARLVIGDRQLKFSVPEQSIWISPKNLEEIDPAAATMEYTAANPFGPAKSTARVRVKNLEFIRTIYDGSTTITIIEKNPPEEKGLDKTIYSENFFGFRGEANELFDDVSNGHIDADDLIFELRELKEDEKAYGEER